MKLLIVSLAFIVYLGTCQAGSDEEKAFNVTLSVFSGVPNPQWLITPKSLNYKKIKELLGAAKSKKAKYLPEQMPAQLGYKGFLVQEDGEDEPSLIVGPKTKDLQEELLKSCPPKSSKALKKKLNGKKLLKVLEKVIKAAKVIPVALKVIKALKSAGSKRYPPVFEGAANLWNSPTVQPNNNCYNYGNDVVTNTFAQPGRGTGRMYREVTFEEVKQAAIRDGLREVQPGPGGSIPYVSPDSPDHLVALVVDPGVDFHWYRLDSNGRWSHKPGGTPITNKDGNGELIDDPREAANHPQGFNYQFVCFMKTNKKQIQIE